MISTNREMSSLSSPEYAALKPVLAFIPVGATEQHGPNLGMGVDYRIAEELARRAAGRMTASAVVTPPLPIGLSAHHLDFPGTLHISFETFQSLCIDIVKSLASHGIERFIFVNGHMGNMNALGVITTTLRYDHGYRVATAFWMHQAKEVIGRHTKTDRWGHACEIETSVAMELTPDLVKGDALEAGDLIDDYLPGGDNYQPGALQLPMSFRERTRNGAFGDGTQASLAAGAEIVDAALERMVVFADAFAGQ